MACCNEEIAESLIISSIIHSKADATEHYKLYVDTLRAEMESIAPQHI